MDATSQSTSTHFDYIEGYYRCNPNSFLNCCPWRNDNTKLNIVKTQPTILYDSIEPTSTDSNGEYYTFTSAATSSDQLSISCTDPNGCYITCSGDEACSGMTIYAGDTNYLLLTCTNQNSCDGLFISRGPKIQADIVCDGI